MGIICQASGKYKEIKMCWKDLVCASKQNKWKQICGLNQFTHFTIKNQSLCNRMNLPSNPKHWWHCHAGNRLIWHTCHSVKMKQMKFQIYARTVKSLDNGRLTKKLWRKVDDQPANIWESKTIISVVWPSNNIYRYMTLFKYSMYKW